MMSERWKTRRSTTRSKAMSELNLTPMIDVMFSILVIFMVAAPLMSSGIPLDLPKAQGKIIEADQKVLNIGVDKKGKVYLGSDEVDKDKIVDKIKAMVTSNQELRLMISADKTAPYGVVVEVMGDLKAAGFSKVGLKTDYKPPKKGR